MLLETIISASQTSPFAFEEGGDEAAAVTVNAEMPEAESLKFREVSNNRTFLQERKFTFEAKSKDFEKIKEFVESFSRESSIFGKEEKASLPKPPFFEAAKKESTKESTLKMQPQPKENFKIAKTEVSKARPEIARETPTTKGLHSSSRFETKKSDPFSKYASHVRGEKGQKWSHMETLSFWENRYFKREDEKQQKRDQGHHEEKEDKKQKVHKIDKKASHLSASSSNRPPSKPILDRPKMGVFALYFLLTKLGILSDGSSNYAYKQEIELIDAQTTKAHQSRLEEMRKALEKEEASKRWGISQKVFSWIGSCFGIIAGIVLIATGVGAVAGAMMLVGGIIQLTSQIMEVTGGWTKIAELLPGEDREQKRAVVSWIQIGIAVLCLVLAGVGAVWGGFGTVGEALSTASNCIGAIAGVGYGVTSIGEGISNFMYYDRLSEAKRFEKILAELRHLREDLMDKVDSGLDRLEQLFEDLARALEFEVEIFRADQAINRG